MVQYLNEIVILLGLSLHNVAAQCTAETRPLALTVTAFPLILTSPNYPNNYPPDQNCSWLLTTGDVYSKIIINLMDVQTDSLVKCAQADHLVIYDDSSNSASTIVGTELCEGNADSQVNAYVSSTDSLYVEFFSNSVTESRGFRMLAFKNDSAYQSTGCGGHLQADNSIRVLMSPYLPDRYDNDVDCLYNVTTSTPGAGIRVDLYFGDYEYSDYCVNDYMSIYPDTSDLFFICNSSQDNDFISLLYNTSASVLINFYTDSNNPFYGFMLTYVEYTTGVNLFYPSEGQNISLSVPENRDSGFVDITTAYIEAFGSDNFTITPVESSGPFGLAHPGGIKYFLYINSTLDYESEQYYFPSFLLTENSLDDFDIIIVNFTIDIEDIDEYAPIIHNLPVSIDIPSTTLVGDTIFTVHANDSDGSPNYSNVVYELSVNPGNQFNIDSTTGYVSLAVETRSLSVMTGVITVTAYNMATADQTLPFFEGPFRQLSSSTPKKDKRTMMVLYHSPEINKLSYCFSGYSTSSNLYTTGNISFSISSNTTTTSTTTIAPTTTETATTTTTSIPPKPTGTDTTTTTTIPQKPTVPDTTTTTTNAPNNTETATTTTTYIPPKPTVPDTTTTTTIVPTTTTITARTRFSCWPNPRRVDVRMDAGVGTVLLTDLNCTTLAGVSYNVLHQHPSNTFQFAYQTNGPYSLILNAPVYKIKFYTLRMNVSDGTDNVILNFNVNVQTVQCSPEDVSSGNMGKSLAINIRSLALLVILFISRVFDLMFDSLSEVCQ